MKEKQLLIGVLLVLFAVIILKFLRFVPVMLLAIIIAVVGLVVFFEGTLKSIIRKKGPRKRH